MSLWPVAQKAAIAAELRADRLVSASETYFDGLTFTDDYLYNKILSSEKEASRRLRVQLELTEIISEDTPQSVEDAFIAAGTPYVRDPAYPWDYQFFDGNRWGFIAVRHRPVIKVTRVAFIYPSTNTSLYSFPIEWIRVDNKFGQIRIVPRGEFTELPLNVFLLQVHGGGREVPHMLNLEYQAGIKDAFTEYPDLIDTIKKMAIIRVLEDQFLPQSGSISVDGLTETFSVDVDKYRDQINHKLDYLKQEIHGITMGVI